MSDIAELFTRDPLKITKEEDDLIIAKYREARTQFNLGVQQAGNTKRIKKDVPKITNLDDILGDL